MQLYQDGSYSSHSQDLQLALTPHVSSKDINTFAFYPELDILEDHTLDNIKHNIVFITSSLSNIQRNQINNASSLENFRDKMLEEVAFLSKNVLSIFIKLSSLKKDQATSAQYLAGKFQVSDHELLVKINAVNDHLSTKIDSTSSQLTTVLDILKTLGTDTREK